MPNLGLLINRPGPRWHSLRPLLRIALILVLLLAGQPGARAATPPDAR